MASTARARTSASAPRARWWRPSASASSPSSARGGGVWSFIHIGDAADATVNAIEGRGRGVYNIVDDEPAAVAEWLPVAAEAVDAPAPRREIAALYRELARNTGSAVVELNRAVAVAETEGTEAGLEIVERFCLDDYQYLHATRAELLRRLGRHEQARVAYRRALELVRDERERCFLERRLAEL